eukprot:6166140-Pyramimonas_sp.AAC.2
MENRFAQARMYAPASADFRSTPPRESSPSLPADIEPPTHTAASLHKVDTNSFTRSASVVSPTLRTPRIPRSKLRVQRTSSLGD